MPKNGSKRRLRAYARLLADLVGTTCSLALMSLHDERRWIPEILRPLRRAIEAGDVPQVRRGEVIAYIVQDAGGEMILRTRIPHIIAFQSLESILELHASDQVTPRGTAPTPYAIVPLENGRELWLYRQ